MSHGGDVERNRSVNIMRHSWWLQDESPVCQSEATSFEDLLLMKLLPVKDRCEMFNGIMGSGY